MSARFKTYNINDYTVRIDATAPAGSPYIVGSVITPTSDTVSWNADRTELTIGASPNQLTAVTQITLITNLEKIVILDDAANTDKIYFTTAEAHRQRVGDNLLISGNEVDEFNGSFNVTNVLSSRSFIVGLRATAVGLPSAPSIIDLYSKHPVLKMYYQHKYKFMLGDSSLQGYFMSFSKDNLFKLEYSFNSITRVGTPGYQVGNQPEPYVQISINNDVTNISYYFDPSRTGATSPVDAGTYMDVVTTPYHGNFVIYSTSGGTITTGDTIFKFCLLYTSPSPRDQRGSRVGGGG